MAKKAPAAAQPEEARKTELLLPELPLYLIQNEHTAQASLRLKLAVAVETAWKNLGPENQALARLFWSRDWTDARWGQEAADPRVYVEVLKPAPAKRDRCTTACSSWSPRERTIEITADAIGRENHEEITAWFQMDFEHWCDLAEGGHPEFMVPERILPVLTVTDYKPARLLEDARAEFAAKDWTLGDLATLTDPDSTARLMDLLNSVSCRALVRLLDRQDKDRVADLLSNLVKARIAPKAKEPHSMTITVSWPDGIKRRAEVAR